MTQFVQDVTHMKDRFIGKSTDAKPTARTYIGALFDETDTGDTYIYTQGGWVIYDKTRSFDRMIGADRKDLRVTNLDDREVQEEILSELRKMNRHLSEITDLEGG